MMPRMNLVFIYKALQHERKTTDQYKRLSG